MKENLKWKEISRQEVCKTRVVTLQQTTSISPEGKTGNYIVMDAPDWVIVIPEIFIDSEKHFIMVEQWRHGIQSLSIEFPGGVINADERPENAAKRELLEETGYEAKELVALGTVSPNPAIMSNKVHFFCGKNLVNTHKTHLDSDEFCELIIKSEKEVYQQMGREPYIHGLMCAAYDMYRRHN